MQTFPQQFLCIPSHARCAHRFLSSGTQQSYKQIKKIRKPLILKVSLKKIERVMGIEPTYPAWKAGVLPLNYTRISVGVTGFEPATSWSQTRRSSQAEPHPESIVFHYTFKTSYRFRVFWSSPRSISNSQLHVLPHFHLCPIYLVVFKGSYPLM